MHKWVQEARESGEALAVGRAAFGSASLALLSIHNDDRALKTCICVVALASKRCGCANGSSSALQLAVTVPGENDPELFSCHRRLLPTAAALIRAGTPPVGVAPWVPIH